jgi:hypothetical protein
MSILEAFCNKCANRAGRNGSECDRCAKLKHAKPIAKSKRKCNEYGGYTCKFKCPYCKEPMRSVPGNLELCRKCDKEFVSEELE